MMISAVGIWALQSKGGGLERSHKRRSNFSPENRDCLSETDAICYSINNGSKKQIY